MAARDERSHLVERVVGYWPNLIAVGRTQARTGGREREISETFVGDYATVKICGDWLGTRWWRNHAEEGFQKLQGITTNSTMIGYLRVGRWIVLYISLGVRRYVSIINSLLGP